MTISTSPRWRPLRIAAASLASLVIGGTLAGCVAVAGGAMLGGSMMAVDRRTTGTQVDDQNIDLAASNVIKSAIGGRGHVNATSYNRVVLLTGEVPTEADRVAAENAIARIPNAAGVVNDLAVMPNASFTQISNDAIITAKVKAAFLDTPQLQVASMKVVTERNVVYLMGRVTDAEAVRAAEVTRGVGGVKKVVKVFSPISPAELAAMPVPPDAVKPAASAPAK
jgi:osmotically-inducible protein OsmY